MTGITGALTPLFAELDAIAEPGQYVSGAVVELRKTIERTTSAHTAPNGEPWADLKDGGKAYDGVMKYIDARQVSPTQAIVEVKGPPAFAQHGTHKMVQRKLIWTETDESLYEALKRGVFVPWRKRAK